MKEIFKQNFFNDMQSIEYEILENSINQQHMLDLYLLLLYWI